MQGRGCIDNGLETAIKNQFHYLFIVLHGPHCAANNLQMFGKKETIINFKARAARIAHCQQPTALY